MSDFEERREGHRREMDNFREEIHEMKEELRDLYKCAHRNARTSDKFIGQAKIVGIVAMAIFGASFAFTQLHEIKADKLFAERKVIDADHTKRVIELEKQAMLTMERHTQLCERVGDLIISINDLENAIKHKPEYN